MTNLELATGKIYIKTNEGIESHLTWLHRVDRFGKKCVFTTILIDGKEYQGEKYPLEMFLERFTPQN